MATKREQAEAGMKARAAQRVKEREEDRRVRIQQGVDRRVERNKIEWLEKEVIRLNDELDATRQRFHATMDSFGIPEGNGYLRASRAPLLLPSYELEGEGVGTVYAAWDSTRPSLCKIGMTMGDVADRLKTLGEVQPVPLVLVASLRCYKTREHEQQILGQLDRVGRSEWVHAYVEEVHRAFRGSVKEWETS